MRRFSSWATHRAICAKNCCAGIWPQRSLTARPLRRGLPRAEAAGRQVTVHVKVDTGMHLLGLAPSHVLNFLSQLATLPGLYAEGIYTHFSTADETDQSYARRQWRSFTDLLAVLSIAGLRPPLAHACQLCRHPQPARKLSGRGAGGHRGLRPASQPGSLAARRLPPGTQLEGPHRPGQNHRAWLEPVSYGNTWIAAPAVHCGDSTRRLCGRLSPRTAHAGTMCSSTGSQRRSAGRVGMDMTVVDVTKLYADGTAVHTGDVVVLIWAVKTARRCRRRR